MGDSPGGAGAPTAASARSTRRRSSPVRAWIEWIVVVGGAVLLAVVLRTFVVQVFSIPSESMLPTLTEGDRVAVEKLTYLRRSPQRGDVVVFDNPELDRAVIPGAGAAPDKLIKRVIGIGGDKIVLQEGAVFVNGSAIDEPYVMAGSSSLPLDAARFPCTAAAPCVVPPATVWVMGDNRERSEDSRAFGPVPVDTIVGRALSVIWPLDRLSGL